RRRRSKGTSDRRITHPRGGAVRSDAAEQLIDRLEGNRLARSSDGWNGGPPIEGARSELRISEWRTRVADGHAGFRMIERRSLKADTIVAEGFEKRVCPTLVSERVWAELFVRVRVHAIVTATR
ncbi:MAG: hypothetical protein JWP63_3831, partial [Candidatus Solibacter sp.]|nr:hypothetical protein [Candidatus Solibacter sp.]